MIFELLKLNVDVPDEEFDSIYPEKIQKLSKKQWSSVSIAKQAAEFLAERPGTRVLDIGSGVGKFCLIGASHTRGHFTGVEQRVDLVEISNNLAMSHNVPNVKFIHTNITSIRFRDYDAFYFYNPFHENVALYGHIDHNIDGNSHLYDVYTLFTHTQFASLPVGTRVVTYHSPLEITPSTFKLVYCSGDELLRFLEKRE